MRIFRWFVCLLLPLALAGADPSPPIPLVGAIYNLTGSQAVLDLPSSQGARLAAEHLRSKIRLEIRDGKSQVSAIAQTTRSLLAQHPAGLLGLSDTGMLEAAAPVASQQGVPFLTSGATSPRLAGRFPGLFLACFGDNVQAAAGAEFVVHHLKATRIVVLWNEDMEYTRLLAGYFRSALKEMKVEPVLEQAYAGEESGFPRPERVLGLAAGQRRRICGS